MTLHALIPDRLFDGDAFRDGDAVTIEHGRIAGVIPVGEIPPGASREPVPGLLAPGFVDIQVNGGGGVLLNDDPSPAVIARIAAAHRRFGTTGLLPTLITDTRDRMAAALTAVRAAIAAGSPGVLGVHLEGPFLNPARKGVHDGALMRSPDEEDFALLTAGGADVVHVTLAPECVPEGAIRRLTEAGIVVSAGHTEASPERLSAARNEGLRGYTHLFNAMPPFAGRAPSPVGAALADREAFCSVIADLRHVSASTLMAVINAKGPDRTMLVTDAMSAVGTDLAEFVLQGRRIVRKNGCLRAPDGTLAGSDLDMASAVRNIVSCGAATLGDALVMASRTPAAFIGLGRERGRIAEGFRGDMVALDADGRVGATWLAGSRREF